MVRREEPRSPTSLDARLLAAVEGAEGELEQVRAALTDAGRGADGSREALAVLAEHWGQHKAVYGAVARLIAEEFRTALLGEIEGWKRQLRDQLEAPQGDRERPRGQARDAALDQLRARLASTDSALDRAEVLLDLGELHVGRNEDTEAEERLREAEQELEPYRERATGSGIADVLLEALPSMARGETRDLRVELDVTMRAARMLERVYDGLARVVDDAEEAQRYLERHRALRESLARGSQGTLDFKGKLLEELSRQSGRTGPAASEGDGPPG
jgi:predicted metal-dependent hydrolase